MTPKERAHNDAGIKCRLANERFGLQMGMRKLLERFNLNDHAVDYVIDLAKKRELLKFDDVLSTIGTWEVKKPHYVRIKSIVSYDEIKGICTHCKGGGCAMCNHTGIRSKL